MSGHSSIRSDALPVYRIRAVAAKNALPPCHLGPCDFEPLPGEILASVDLFLSENIDDVTLRDLVVREGNRPLDPFDQGIQ